PGDAGIGIAALRRVGHQHRKIRSRTAENLVETIIRGFDRGPFAALLAHLAARGDQSAQEWPRPLIGCIAAYRKEKRAIVTGRKAQIVNRNTGRELFWLRIK